MNNPTAPEGEPAAGRAGRRLWAEGVLLGLTLVWGATFVLVKDAISIIPLHWFLALRFGLAGVTFWAAIAWIERPGGAPPLRGGARRGVILAGVSLGILLFAGYEFQTLGLLTTSAMKSGFITGTIALWTPVLAFVALRRRPRLEALAGAVLGLAGLYLLVMHGTAAAGAGGSAEAGIPPAIGTQIAPAAIAGGEPALALAADAGPVIGDLLTLLCAVMFAAHLLVTRHAGARHPVLWLTATQLSTVAVLSLVAHALTGETPGWDYPARAWFALVFCSVLATSVAFWAQTHMQRHVSEEQTALIFMFEPVFAAAVSWIALGERMSAAQWGGAALIFAAVVLPGTRTDTDLTRT